MRAFFLLKHDFPLNAFGFLYVMRALYVHRGDDSRALYQRNRKGKLKSRSNYYSSCGGTSHIIPIRTYTASGSSLAPHRWSQFFLCVCAKVWAIHNNKKHHRPHVLYIHWVSASKAEYMHSSTFNVLHISIWLYVDPTSERMMRGASCTRPDPSG